MEHEKLDTQIASVIVKILLSFQFLHVNVKYISLLQVVMLYGLTHFWSGGEKRTAVSVPDSSLC